MKSLRGENSALKDLEKAFALNVLPIWTPLILIVSLPVFSYLGFLFTGYAGGYEIWTIYITRLFFAFFLFLLGICVLGIISGISALVTERGCSPAPSIFKIIRSFFGFCLLIGELAGMSYLASTF